MFREDLYGIGDLNNCSVGCDLSAWRCCYRCKGEHRGASLT
jgi:hypothetical protein